MAETSKVFKGVSITDSLKNYLAIRNVSLCQFLYFLNIADIAQHIENNFYSDKYWHFKYDVSAMIKFAVIKFFRQQPYKKIVLSEEEAWLLGFKEKDGEISVPSGGTLHHFVKYRLGVEGINKIMEMVGEKIIKLIDSKDAKLDSTPLEASRYDTHSEFNPYYECKMDKAHITMIGTYPIFMTYTDGLAGDSLQVPEHISVLLKMNAKLEEYRLDGGYDSFENHADIWYKLKAKPLISLPIDAVINAEGELHRIDHWANKMWKLGGSRHMKIDDKLRFLYENGRQEQVGMYLRNQNLKDKTFPESCKLRQECERIHGHIKNTVKFDVRRIREESRELYTKFNFVAYQLLLLTNLQNSLKPANAFENYI
ncbi:MAG: ISNCY family transposase [Candidatus Methanoperedens sp.]|nr:ISNCY family transposase [Candidatus Methanoperedens sp.]MCZ7385038.1 ISNCY family transposase [Candidatus Methanoperedens sp.]